MEGMLAQSQFTVSSSASLGASSTFSININYPETDNSAFSGFTATTSVTNTQTESFTVTHNTQETITFRMTAPDGKTCSSDQTTKSCTIQGTGKVQLIAKGYVWFEYDDPVEDKEDTNPDTKNQKHRKWAIDLATILPEASERSAYITIEGGTSLNIKASFEGKCT
eukprot:GHVO01054862.1.p1 GENE.GHVO01054862.1~~GHVO01054862.1.p1  ORF type:complete len:166 (+),score=11.97 GHVO01054862.1:407-904(+)